MQPDSDARRWTAIIPVKGLADAKSRLLDLPIDTAELALAFLCDVLTAVSGTELVGETIVVTSDEQVAQVAASAGASVVDDAGYRGINAAAGWAVMQRSGIGPVVVLVSDLPSLTSPCLARVLAAAEQHRTSFLADAEGSGTTMWLDRDGQGAGPHFGPQSRAAHRSHGATDLAAVDPSTAGVWLAARLDVDTAADLERARAVGVGAATTRVLSALPAARPVTVLRQEENRVVVVAEDGRSHSEPLDGLRAAGWRDLRRGQRVDLPAAPSETFPTA